MESLMNHLREGFATDQDLKTARDIDSVMKKLKEIESKLKKNKNPSSESIRKAIKLLEDASYDIAFPKG